MPGGRPRLPESEKLLTIAFRISPKELESLRALAKSEGRSLAALLRDAALRYEKAARRKIAVAA